ncbi:MAG: hypothetical protein M9934_02160 [Thermomicrobiales bacterium]|nr:hypothetical protein [Thermomicrobiales bacterium]MCO5218352.1 hypothetical protein [Thermomicrobiales bacterium]MCO5227074.1 hypothetical protein [Thermomicrobiales bacterium]
MEKPSYISVQGHAIKVQQWRVQENDIAVTTIATGDRSAADILAQIGRGAAPIGWEGMEATEATIQLTDHWVTGEGATAVHRIAFLMAADAFPRLQPRFTLAERFEIVLEEVDRLRKQVADLESRIDFLEQAADYY